MYKPVIENAKDRMSKTLASVQKELSMIRAGRANPKLLEKVQVEYYGTMSPISAVANVSVPEARMLVIAPWEPKMLGVIEKAILKSDIGITPTNDGKVIRLMFPEPTEERRKELVKGMRKQIEEAKVAIRNIRRDANDQVKKLKKDSSITEDDAKDAENELQKATDNAIKEADKIAADKEKEIMSI